MMDRAWFYILLASTLIATVIVLALLNEWMGR
jgi:hypothetical protein